MPELAVSPFVSSFPLLVLFIEKGNYTTMHNKISNTSVMATNGIWTLITICNPTTNVVHGYYFYYPHYLYSGFVVIGMVVPF